MPTEPTIEIRSVSGELLYVSHSSNVPAALEEAANAGANLRGADLYGADLHGADLYGANLHEADLYEADLRGAENAELAAAQTNIIPAGDIIGWKKARNNLIIQLRIPADAKRSNGTGRKCRTERAEILAITDKTGNPVTEAFSTYDETFRYEVGTTVFPTEPFDENRWNECSSGLHFYITREEAEAHV